MLSHGEVIAFILLWYIPLKTGGAEYFCSGGNKQNLPSVCFLIFAEGGAGGVCIHGGVTILH